TCSVSGRGGLIGACFWGTITNCYATGNVLGSGGGLIGNSYAADGGMVTIISNCYATGSVSGSGGGLVRENQGMIFDSHATGNVLATRGNSGGLVGWNKIHHSSAPATVFISNCYATGSVSGKYSVGGLVGSNGGDGIISNCYASGNCYDSGANIDPPAAHSSVGGLVGSNGDAGSISNCYAIGNIQTVYGGGGLVGENSDEATIADCYATGNILAIDVAENPELEDKHSVGGLVGRQYNNATISNCYS
ncbi:unnamed protein product, partial [marine sediment metagenome]